MPIRVLLADDHELLRKGLRTILEAHPTIQVVGEANDGRTAVRLAQELSPNVALLALSMPRLNGIEATRQMRSTCPGVRAVILSSHSDNQYMEQALKAGAFGYVLKDSTAAGLIRTIEAVSAGRPCFSPRPRQRAGERLPQAGRPPDSGTAALTSREREVLQLIAEGHRNKEIAQLLHISVNTVETHREQLMKKLNLRTVAELTKYAIRHGLTSLD